MDTNMCPASNRDLTTLPVEIQQLIAAYLPSDEDVANLALVSKGTSISVTSSVWRQRFLQIFDPVQGLSASEFHEQYAFRRGLESQYIQFDQGHHPFHEYVLQMLQDMIIQSNAVKRVDADGNEMVIGLNHQFFSKYFGGGNTRGCNLPDSVGRTQDLFPTASSARSNRSPGSRAVLIQLCFLHLSLNPRLPATITSTFHLSQEQVYKCYTQEPIFKGKNKQEINIRWLSHVASFFRFHLRARNGEGILTHIYNDFEPNELPRAWAGKLSENTQQLGRRWKGTYTSLELDELRAFRDPRNNILPVDETIDGNNGFLDLLLFFDIDKHPELRFGVESEKILHGSPTASIRDSETGARKLPEVKDFFGLGNDGKPYHLYGRLHALPPQSGIPGFQRVTMIKHLPDMEGQYGLGRSSLWAYEGCVMPGGEMILGRWWSPGINPNEAEDGRSFCGPFIFWGVAESEIEKLEGVESALRFLDLVAERTVW